jgi:nitrite reductase/ring-hydroxylating ferredoxin subunit
LAWVLSIHCIAGWRERILDGLADERARKDGWIDVCAVDEIPEKRARIVSVAGDRVAVFRFDGQVAALSNACQHQNGPLGEGRIVDGCVTCPWHGYQYLPDCGRSPEPFTEKVPTFRTRIVQGRVLLHSVPLPAGTLTAPSRIHGADDLA